MSTATQPLAPLTGTRNWTVPANQVKPGDRFRALGPGYLGRDVTAVKHACRCALSSGRIERQPDGTIVRPCYPVVVVSAGDFHCHLAPDSPVTLTNGY